MAIHGRTLFLFLLVCFQRTLIAQEPTTRCQTNQTGITATITVKIDRASMRFFLSKYPLNSSDIEETVVDCSKTPCKVADGYEFELAPGPVQHVKIPTVDKSFEGRYQAQYYSEKPEKYGHCTLIYQAPPNGTTAKEHPEGDTPDNEGEAPPNGTTAKEHPEGDTPDNEGEAKESTHDVLSVGLTVLGVVLAAAAGGVCLVSKAWMIRCKWILENKTCGKKAAPPCQHKMPRSKETEEELGEKLLKMEEVRPVNN